MGQREGDCFLGEILMRDCMDIPSVEGVILFLEAALKYWPTASEAKLK